jgi:PAS domain S-box-containing protein
LGDAGALRNAAIGRCETDRGEERDQVIRRLSSFDLLKQLEGLAPVLLVQVVVGVGLAVLAVGLRAVLPLAPPAATFALLFPAILVATGLAGWEAGLAALASGVLFSWRILLAPTGAWDVQPAEGASLALYGLSSGLVIAAAAVYRATALALRDSRERLDLATSAAKLGVWEWRLDTGEMICSDEIRRIYGFARDEPMTCLMVRAATHPEDAPVTLAQSQRALDPDIRDDAPFEYRVIRPDGEVRWVYVTGRAVFEQTPQGLVATRFVGVLQDITARKADEERMRLLAREVDHRANNLLAVVQGTVALSQAEDASTLKRVITGRVNALARAHQLLAKARWEGADLRSLVEEELLPFSLGDEARVWISGAPVALPPAAAQSVAMALHELATNAAKYGALSTAEGRVEVSWSRDAEGALTLSWRELGGPPVRAPNRHGLGTRLLGRALAGTVGGGTRLDWRPEGLVCVLSLPSSAQESAIAPVAQAAEAV